MRAVCPIWLSTCCAFVTPGMETEIWFLPVVWTCAPDTPRPFDAEVQDVDGLVQVGLGHVLPLGGVDDRHPAGEVQTQAR